MANDTVTGSDAALTARVKAYALHELNADLVGVANIERFANAPVMMSPQGLLPAARSVVVMALHHPDACIELGGAEHPQVMGPYRVQGIMNARLDELSYRLGLWLEREGYDAVPIVSSNIWRYKGYKELTEHFAPDLSHRHSAVAAGLADFGYSALAITPEYGARQRFVTVVTTAPLQPTPLVEPHSVCDDCRKCVDMCPARALSKELRGTSVVRIEGHEYTYADKNLWRCSWGEHFDLDLDLPIPEVVDEAVILEQLAIHGRRGGEMGCCLRYCVPEPRRYYDYAYSDAPRRIRDVVPEAGADRTVAQRLEVLASRHGADFLVVRPASELAGAVEDLDQLLPGARTVLAVGLHYLAPGGPDVLGSARRYLLESAAYDLTRELERHGHDAVCCSDFPEPAWAGRLGGVLPGRAAWTATVLTTAELPSTSPELPAPAAVAAERLPARLRGLLAELGADLVGVAPAARLTQVKQRLAPLFDGRPVFHARDKGIIHQPYLPEVQVGAVKVTGPDDHLPGARSVVVIGLRIPRAAVERTGLPPAESVGPYAFAQYQSANLLRLMALRVSRVLEDSGYRAAVTFDLCGTGSTVGNPRGEQPDAFCNRFAAVAAGLGRLTRAGFVTTPELGPNVRFVAVVTEAALPADPTLADDGLLAACEDCDRCLAACRTDAFADLAEVAVDGIVERFHVIRRDRCDWAKRYSLIGEEGVNYLGWDMHLDPPELITLEAVADGLRQHPAIPKYRPCNFEACLMACPMAR